MGKLISRRTLLGNGIKTSIALIALRDARTVVASARETEANGKFQPAFQRLDEFIARHMNETGAPGMTLALADQKGLLRESQYGFADVKSQLKVSPQTLFEIGSISKSFVALAILQLVDEGKLDLHKPVQGYLPWLKIESEFKPITTHHLLSHTAGLSGVPLLNRVASTTLRTGSEPGAQFLYSNIGYDLLGFLVEAVDQRPFAESLQVRVLDLLGMNSSAPIITSAIRRQLAVGYAPLQDDRPFPLRGVLGEAAWVEVSEAAGSVAATAKDMSAYLQMLLNRGVGRRGRVISEQSFKLLTKPVIKAPFRGEESNYGYGLWTSEVNGHRLLRHTGGMVAFSSAMYADISDGFAAFASVNASLRGYRPVAVTRYALDLLSAVANEKDLPVLPPAQPVPTQVKNAGDYAGVYTSPTGAKLTLSNQGEQLVLEHKNRHIMLEQVGRDRFIVKDPDFELFVLGFGREKDQVVEAFHGADWWTNERYAGPKNFDFPKDWETYTGRYKSDSPWYGGTRLVIRKGRLLIDGEQPLLQISPGVFRPEGGSTADRMVFDSVMNGKASHFNYSGIDFYRIYTP